MKKRRNWKRGLEQIICQNRPLDRGICRCKRNLDEVARVLCEGDEWKKINPRKKIKKVEKN